jgi:hypothetical protein
MPERWTVRKDESLRYYWVEKDAPGFPVAEEQHAHSLAAAFNDNERIIGDCFDLLFWYRRKTARANYSSTTDKETTIACFDCSAKIVARRDMKASQTTKTLDDKHDEDCPHRKADELLKELYPMFVKTENKDA